MYSQRGTISSGGASQEGKRKRSLKFSTVSGTDPDNDDNNENNAGTYVDQNGGTLNVECGERYAALTEITTPETLECGSEGSPVTREDKERSTGTENGSVEGHSKCSLREQSDVINNDSQRARLEVAI